MEKTKKILILERVSEPEWVLCEFINQYLADHEIVFVGGVDRVAPEIILKHISECDAIAAQSIFDDTSSFEKMIALFHAKKITKPVYLISSHNRLIEALNFRISVESHQMLTKMLENGLPVTNVYYEEFENPENKDEVFQKKYFKSRNILKFDPIPIWYNKEAGLIWDTRQKYIPNTSKNYFKYNAYYLEKAPQVSVYDKLSPVESKLLKEVLSNVYVMTEEQKEDLEHGQTKYLTEDEVTSLLDEKTRIIDLLDKLKIVPFK